MQTITTLTDLEAAARRAAAQYGTEADADRVHQDDFPAVVLQVAAPRPTGHIDVHLAEWIEGEGVVHETLTTDSAGACGSGRARG